MVLAGNVLRLARREDGTGHILKMGDERHPRFWGRYRRSQRDDHRTWSIGSVKRNTAPHPALFSAQIFPP